MAQRYAADIEATPDLAWRWRDNEELENHVAEGFYTPALAAAARAEGARVIEAMLRYEHPSVRGWREWSPPTAWSVPPFVEGWATCPTTRWDKSGWAYGGG